MDRARLLQELDLFSLRTGGIGSWITEETDAVVFERLGRIEEEPLTKVQLNQLLVLGHEAPVSDGFFRYYWLSCPESHPYPVANLPGYDARWPGSPAIVSLAHLKWGLYRLFVDGLLWFGNVREAFRELRDLTLDQITGTFSDQRFATELIKQRGPALALRTIPKDDRYLISEMACKSFGDAPGLRI